MDIYSLESLEKKGLVRIGYCRGIPSYVTHIDWSKDSKYLQVCVCVCVCCSHVFMRIKEEGEEV